MQLTIPKYYSNIYQVPLAIPISEIGPFRRRFNPALCISSAKKLASEFKSPGLDAASRRFDNLRPLQSFGLASWVCGFGFWPKPTNFQLLIVSDCSSAEGARKVLATLASRDSRIKAIVLKSSGAYG